MDLKSELSTVFFRDKPFPMFFQVAKMTNTNGEAFQITVVGKTGSENFRGFFIQARFVQTTVNIMTSN
jgi:hypothetical protein